MKAWLCFQAVFSETNNKTPMKFRALLFLFVLLMIGCGDESDLKSGRDVSKLYLPDLYLLAKLPLTYELWVYAVVSAVSISIAILAGYLPALLASRVNPVNGFRGNQGA